MRSIRLPRVLLAAPVLAACVLAAGLVVPTRAQTPASAPRPAHPTPATASASAARPASAAAGRDAAVAKWRALKYGMFIHWGLFSAAGGEWQGERVTKGYSEQIQMWANIGRADYAALATRFTAERFDPDATARLAKDAGMRYIILTAKHHDGFSLFGTKQSPYNIVDATPFAKDAVRALADAARRQGLGFGVYFSLVDWHQGHAFDPNNNNPIPPAMEAFIEAQLRELLGDYGPMVEVWFDMSSPTPAQSQRFADIVHTLQPDALVNGRIWNNRGDFIVLGDNQVPDFPIRDPWETPASIYHATWGYRAWQERTDLAGKVKELTRNLVRVAARGGVYLLNIGPRGDGSVVDFEADVLRGIGAWLRANGEAVYDTTMSPLTNLPWGEATLRGRTLYLHVIDWPADGRLIVPGLLTTPSAVRTLKGASTLPWTRAGDDLVLDLSGIKPDPIVTVLQLDLPEAPRVAPPVVFTADDAGAFRLPWGVWQRERSRAGGDYYAQRWTIVRLQADLRVPRAGRYALTLDGVSAPAAGPLRLRVGGETRELTPVAAGGRLDLGTFAIGAGARAGGVTRIEIELASPELPQQDIGLRFAEATLTPVTRR